VAGPGVWRLQHRRLVAQGGDLDVLVVLVWDQLGRKKLIVRILGSFRHQLTAWARDRSVFAKTYRRILTLGSPLLDPSSPRRGEAIAPCDRLA